MNEPLELLDTKNAWNLKRSIISTFVEAYFLKKNLNEINILEARCGLEWNLDIKNVKYNLVGLDLSKEALEIRKYKRGDLDGFIVGDVRSVWLPFARYDMIYCSYVLEHISGALKVLDNFFQWLRIGGLLVLIIPDRSSARGFITRITPQWIHLFYYKHILKYPHAGKPGHTPFPTYLEKIVSRRGIIDYCRHNGYKIHAEYGEAMDTEKIGAVAILVRLVLHFVSLTSFGKLSRTHSDLIYIIEKK